MFPRIWVDFNAGTEDDGFFILTFVDIPIAEAIATGAVDISRGVLLYQDGDEGYPYATVSREFVPILDREEWVARIAPKPLELGNLGHAHVP